MHYAFRFAQLMLALPVMGCAIALMVQAELGLAPWEILHQGIAERTGLSIGTVMVAGGFLVLLTWPLLGVRVGIGTVLNMLLVGIWADLFIALIPVGTALSQQLAMTITGALLSGVATAAYIGAGFGPGPRDGLMLGLATRSGATIRLVRTCIEVFALAAGWLLGGTIGIGTVVFVATIGPIVHSLLPVLTLREPVPLRVRYETE